MLTTAAWLDQKALTLASKTATTFAAPWASQSVTKPYESKLNKRKQHPAGLLNKHSSPYLHFSTVRRCSDQGFLHISPADQGEGFSHFVWPLTNHRNGFWKPNSPWQSFNWTAQFWPQRWLLRLSICISFRECNEITSLCQTVLIKEAAGQTVRWVRPPKGGLESVPVSWFLLITIIEKRKERVSVWCQS